MSSISIRGEFPGQLNYRAGNFVTFAQKLIDRTVGSSLPLLGGGWPEAGRGPSPQPSPEKGEGVSVEDPIRSPLAERHEAVPV